MIQDENKTKFRRCAKFLSSLTPFCKYILLLWDSITFYAWKTILANIFKRKTCSIRKIIILIKIGKALSFCCIKESYSPMLGVETLNVGFIHYISLLMELEYIAILCIKSKLLEVIWVWYALYSSLLSVTIKGNQELMFKQLHMCTYCWLCDILCLWCRDNQEVSGNISEFHA